jgi:hypothetical protein
MAGWNLSPTLSCRNPSRGNMFFPWKDRSDVPVGREGSAFSAADGVRLCVRWGNCDLLPAAQGGCTAGRDAAMTRILRLKSGEDGERR